jgi:hypothetical protein
MQPSSIRWSSAAQLYTLDAALLRGAYDPSANNVAATSHRPIDAVIDFVLKPEFQDTTAHGQRFDVRNQTYRCRIFGRALSTVDQRDWTSAFQYDDIKHTLAFDNFAACHPFLHGHSAISNMPTTWDPRIHRSIVTPMHVPDIAAERHLPLPHPDDSDAD